MNNKTPTKQREQIIKISVGFVTISFAIMLLWFLGVFTPNQLTMRQISELPDVDISEIKMEFFSLNLIDGVTFDINESDFDEIFSIIDSLNFTRDGRRTRELRNEAIIIISNDGTEWIIPMGIVFHRGFYFIPSNNHLDFIYDTYHMLFVS